jgi:L-rhamnose mutarotase
VPDREELMHKLKKREVNQRWPQFMAPILEAAFSLREGETAAFMDEVLYM